MLSNPTRSDRPEEPIIGSRKSKRSIQQSQDVIYASLLELVKLWPAEDVLLEFKNLFILHVNSFSSDVFSALYEIVFTNNQTEFINTLKRSCYILINNWGTRRNHKPIQELVQIFSDPSLKQRTLSPTLKRLRSWVKCFVESPDFQELKLFVARYDADTTDKHWKQRYTAFLLAPQYEDLDNPAEQREAARALSNQLRERFKFDLAMYVTRSQSFSPLTAPIASKHRPIPRNPTALGDEALRLIKTIIVRRGPFSYANLARIFLKQTCDLTYKEFKASLLEYLSFSLENQAFATILKTRLADKLASLYERHHEEVLTSAMVLRTCNRVVEYLLTEDQHEPSHLFIALLSESNPLSMVIVLLKIILISSPTRPHLEARIAQVIRYYEDLPEQECQWIIHFLEVLNVTFAIYAENVEYNLVKVSEVSVKPAPFTSEADIENYRIFSQQKIDRKPKLDPEAFSLDENPLESLNQTDQKK